MTETIAEGQATYRVVIETANAYAGSGGKENFVLLEMTGADGTVTGAIQLNKLGEDNFQRGAIDVFNIEALDVGLPVLIRLELRHHKDKNPWGVSRVKVIYKGQKAKFPVYDWVVTDLNVTTGGGLLYHKVNNPWVLSVLKQDVEHTRVLLPWVRRPGPTDATRSLPRYVDADLRAELPLIFQPTEIWTQSFGENSVLGKVGKAMIFLQKNQVQLKDLESYHMLYKVFEDGNEPSEFLKRWQSDEDFGRQQLNGIAPLSLQRCTEIPSLCQITGDHVKDLLPCGTTLAAEMKAGKVYMTDFTSVFEHVKRNKNSKGEQLYVPNCICIYRVNSNDDLIPIAIQLVPGDVDTIFTPKDSEHDWLLAKMYFKASFGSMHEWYSHFLLTHGVMESFAVAVFRDLPRCHPLYKLMRPHLQTIPRINLEARITLILAGSAANTTLGLEGEDLAREMYKSFDMDDLNIPRMLKKRVTPDQFVVVDTKPKFGDSQVPQLCLHCLSGLDDEKLLPKFYYRDDAKNLWNIIEDFVASILRHYYHSDEDILADKFLQDLMDDVTIEGIGWEDIERRKGMPCPLGSVNQLATMDRIMKSLPDTAMSVMWIAISSALSAYAPDEVLLGNYPAKLFSDKEAKQAIKKFRRDLQRHEEKVKERNEAVAYPYHWLLPEKIATSISI